MSLDKTKNEKLTSGHPAKAEVRRPQDTIIEGAIKLLAGSVIHSGKPLGRVKTEKLGNAFIFSGWRAKPSPRSQSCATALLHSVSI